MESSSEGNNEDVASPKLSPEEAGEKTAQVIVSDPKEMNDLIASLNMQNHLPSYNVREKIIIAIDTAKERNRTDIVGYNNESIPPFKALCSAVEMFIRLKQRMNSNHEYSLVLLKETDAIFYNDFTTGFRRVSGMLRSAECEAGDSFDLTSLFNAVITKVRTWNFFEDQSIPPPYVVRVVLLYNRSHIVPEITMSQQITDLVNSPYFFLDVLVTHEPICEQNNCEKIFKTLQNIDTKGYSYFFNVGRNLDALVQSMVKLTAHPLQRPLQSVSNYSL